MRFAFLIVAFVSCVVLTTVRAEARPSGDRVAEAKRAKKKTVDKPKAKASPKKTKPSKKAKTAKPENDEAPVVRDAEPPAEPKAAPVAKHGGAPVQQAGDDEIPRNEPSKTKR